jgi:uncharacterized protein (TIGR02217 family)
MSDRVFPPVGVSLENKFSWSNSKYPEFSTKVHRASSFRESRIAEVVFPVWHFTVRFPVLYDDATLGRQLDAILGFYTLHKGSFETFLFQDTHDKTLTDQPIATWDGSGTNPQFQIVRTMGSLNVEPIYEIKDGGTPGAGGLVVKVDPGTGPVVNTNWTENNGIITFTSSPVGLITVSCDFYYRVRFDENEYTVTQLLPKVWRSGEIKLISVKP